MALHYTLLDLVLHCLYLPSCTNDHMHFLFVLQLHALPHHTVPMVPSQFQSCDS